MASDMHEITEQGVATLSDKAWEFARLRAEIIRPLAALEVVGHQAVIFRRRLHQFTGPAAMCAADS